MARRPLWTPLLVLACAWLSAAARAQTVDVNVSNAGAAPVSGAGASVTAGAGVTAVPTLTGGMNALGAAPTLAAPAAAPGPLAAGPLTAAAAATPAAAASPALAAAAPPAAAAARVAAPAGPASVPSIVVAQAAFAKPAAAAAAENAPVARAAAAPDAAAAAHAAGLGSAFTSLFADGSALSINFDGQRSMAHLLGSPPGYSALAEHAHIGAPALKSASKSAASSGAEPGAAPAIAPPAPPREYPVDVAAGKLEAWLGGVWTKIKQGFGAKPPPADVAPEIGPASVAAAAPAPVFGRKIAAAAAEPLESDEGLLVHAPRALRFDALGYRVHFAPPDGAPSEAVHDEPVRVRVERGAGDAGTEALRKRFSAFNALIEANFAALEMIAQSSSKMTVKTGRLVLEKVEEMAAQYSNMVGRMEAVDEVSQVAALGIGFDQAVKGLSDADLLPPKAVALVMPIDSASMHFYINQLHQAALREVGRSDAASPANLVVKLGQGGDERAVSLVDLSEHPLVKNGRLVSPAFKALIEAMRRSKDQPKGSLLLQDHQFWGHFKLGAHSAEVYANFLPPDEGGMIRVRYQEWGTGYDNQTRLYYVARLLQKTGFHVEQDSGYLTAVVDKDHLSQTVDQMTDTFALVIQALHATVGVDFALPMLVAGAKTSEEVGARIDQWVDVVLGEGTLPFYVHDDHGAMVDGWAAYQATETGRERLRAALNKTLASFGLGPIPAGERLGQRTIDRFVNGPIESAIARGELRLTKTGALERSPWYKPLAEMANFLPVDLRAAGQMAEAVSSLDPGLLSFETIGSLGALNVERAERRLEPDARMVVYVLRDPKTGQIGLARAAISDLKPGGSPRPLGPAAMFARLADQGYAIAPFEPSLEPAGLAHFSRLLKSDPVVERSMGRRAQGLAASPGHGRPVFATVTYDKEKAARGGFIFVAPYTSPDDLDAIRASKAVITTSGGLLSHAAITTREMGIPAAILPRAEWRDGAASLEVPEFGAVYVTRGLKARPLAASRGIALAEGAYVRLDPSLGTVEVYPESIGAALHDTEEALSRYDRDGDAGALVSWVQARMAGEDSGFEKAAVSREALEGLAARSLSRPEAAADLGRLYAILPKKDDPLAAWHARSGDELFGALRREALEFLAEKRGAIGAAISVEAVERALRQAETRAARVDAAAAALGRPSTDRAEIKTEISALRAFAESRGGRLLAQDVEELKEHARLFPTATVEVLPRLKAAIAKAKRRGAPAELIEGWERQAAGLERARENAMRARAPVVLALRQVLDMDVPSVGGKAAKLGEISEVVARAGGEVPPGLALTVDAYRQFLKEAGIAEKLDRIASDPGLAPDERAARARKLILGAPLSATAGVGRAIVGAMRAEGLDKTPLAVRSSAVDEDGAEAAFAGAGDTHLYVSPDELLPHVKDVWASLWNPRALLYRQTKGLSTANLAQAVVVQAMAASEVSGVAFTQDPVTGDSSRLIVNAAFGLGEGVVSGRVAPDQYVVGKSLGREILPPMIADKKLAVIRGKDGTGVEEHKMPAEWRRRRAMSPAKLEKLNAVAQALESHFGYALDIEFGFVGDKLYILQARPVTNAASEEPAPPSAAAKTAPKKTSAPAAAAEPETKRLMFVCTGNTCRSPMAERLTKAKLRSEGRSDEFEVLSRGLDVADAAPMSAEAQAALRARGASGDGHVSLALADSDVIWADVILAMTSAQAAEIVRRYPAARGKVFTLGAYSGVGGDVADPFGGDAARYRASAAQIEAAVDSALDRAETPAAH